MFTGAIILFLTFIGFFSIFVRSVLLGVRNSFVVRPSTAQASRNYEGTNRTEFALSIGSWLVPASIFLLIIYQCSVWLDQNMLGDVFELASVVLANSFLALIAGYTTMVLRLDVGDEKVMAKGIIDPSLDGEK